MNTPTVLRRETRHRGRLSNANLIMRINHFNVTARLAGDETRSWNPFLRVRDRWHERMDNDPYEDEPGGRKGCPDVE